MEEKEYLVLLRKARKELPESVFEESRFVVPKIQGMISGKKTVVNNLSKICDILERKPDHLARFLAKDLGTNYSAEGDRFNFYGKFSSILFNQKLEKYLKEFVYCSECGKPDSIILKEGRISFLKCNACGAKRSIRVL